MERKSEHKQVRMLDDLDHVHRFRVSKKQVKIENTEKEREGEGGKEGKVQDQLRRSTDGKIAKMIDQPE